MAFAAAATLLSALQRQLEPLQQLAVERPLLLLGAFILLHAAVFFGSYLLLWRQVVRCWPKLEAHVLSSSTTAGIHGLVVTVGVLWVLAAWDWESFDEPNTPAQTLLMLYSVAYFLEVGGICVHVSVACTWSCGWVGWGMGLLVPSTQQLQQAGHKSPPPGVPLQDIYYCATLDEHVFMASAGAGGARAGTLTL